MLQLILVESIIGPGTISPSGPITKYPGNNFLLVCSANTIYLPHVYLSPILEWYFGPENSSLPSDVVVSNTKNNSNNYSAVLPTARKSYRHLHLQNWTFSSNHNNPL